MFRIRQLPALSSSSSRSPAVRRSMTVRSRCSLSRYRISSSDAFPRWADLSRQSFRIFLPSAVTVFPKSLRLGMDSQCNMINFLSPFRDSGLIFLLIRCAMSQISLPIAARQDSSVPHPFVIWPPDFPHRSFCSFPHSLTARQIPSPCAAMAQRNDSLRSIQGRTPLRALSPVVPFVP